MKAEVRSDVQYCTSCVNSATCVRSIGRMSDVLTEASPLLLLPFPVEWGDRIDVSC